MGGFIYRDRGTKGENEEGELAFTARLRAPVVKSAFVFILFVYLLKVETR